MFVGQHIFRFLCGSWLIGLRLLWLADVAPGRAVAERTCDQAAASPYACRADAADTGRRRSSSPRTPHTARPAVGANERGWRRLPSKVHRDAFLHPFGSPLERGGGQHVRKLVPHRRLDRAALS